MESLKPALSEMHPKCSLSPEWDDWIGRYRSGMATEEKAHGNKQFTIETLSPASRKCVDLFLAPFYELGDTMDKSENVGMEVNVVHYAKATARLVLLQKALAPLPLNLYELPDRGDLVKWFEVADAVKRREMCRCFIGWFRCKEVVDQDIATQGFYGWKGDKVFEERIYRFSKGHLPIHWMTDANVAVAVAHLTMMYSVVKRNVSLGLHLEDDAIYDNAHSEPLERFVNVTIPQFLPVDTDVCMMCGTFGHPGMGPVGQPCSHWAFAEHLSAARIQTEVMNEHVCYAPTSKNSAGYTVTSKGAWKLLESLGHVPVNFNIDWWFNYAFVFVDGLRGYWWGTSSFTQNAESTGEQGSLAGHVDLGGSL
jgi:hypothetical protein